jgi:hypothetical protein
MVQTVCAEEPNNGQSNDTRRVIALVVAIVQLYMMGGSDMKLLWMLANWQRLGFLIVKNIVQDNRMDDPTMLSMSVGQRIENWWRQLGVVDILCKYIDQMVRLCLCVCAHAQSACCFFYTFPNTLNSYLRGYGLYKHLMVLHLWSFVSVEPWIHHRNQRGEWCQDLVWTSLLRTSVLMRATLILVILVQRDP